MSLMKIDKDQVMVNGEYWVDIFNGSIFNQVNDEFITSMMNDGMMISFIIMITHAAVPNY